VFPEAYKMKADHNKLNKRQDKIEKPVVAGEG
jgi:hypothetical protein